MLLGLKFAYQNDAISELEVTHELATLRQASQLLMQPSKKQPLSG